MKHPHLMRKASVALASLIVTAATLGGATSANAEVPAEEALVITEPGDTVDPLTPVETPEVDETEAAPVEEERKGNKANGKKKGHEKKAANAAKRDAKKKAQADKRAQKKQARIDRQAAKRAAAKTPG